MTGGLRPIAADCRDAHQNYVPGHGGGEYMTMSQVDERIEHSAGSGEQDGDGDAVDDGELPGHSAKDAAG